MGPNIKPIKNSKLSILLFLDIKKLLAIPLTPVIRPFRIKNKKTEKPIVIPPINADIGVKLTICIKTNQLRKKREGGIALAARIASPQGVAFHTSTGAAPAERSARRPPLSCVF